jgi:pterin-4a-carbinolamine dehydratase
MKKLTQLCEQFIDMSKRSMLMGALPIQAKESNVPVLAMERWREINGALYKTYRFRRITDRNSFIMQLLVYESSTKHNADIRIEGDSVSLKVQTHDLDKVTELDKEYARYADVLFKSLVYNSDYESED